MPTTPLWLCHQCHKSIESAEHPWTFHTWTGKGELDDVVRFCNINCIAAYYRLVPIKESTHAPK